MKNIIMALCIFGLSTYGVSAQKVLKLFPFNIAGTFKNSYENFKPGTPFRLCNFAKVTGGRDQEDWCVGVVVGDSLSIIPWSQVGKLKLEPTDNQSFWECKALENGLYEMLIDKGYQYDRRQELNDEASDYIRKLNNSRLIYEDSYIEDYVSSVFASVVYQKFNVKKNENLRVYILKSPTPDSYMQPDGTLVVTTGLLSVLDSEEELMALMASEVAHHALDHPIINVNKEVARAKAAVFWGAVAAGALAAGEEYLMQKSEYYVPGTATVAVALVSSAIMEKMTKRMGMTYSRSQEKVADRCAMEFLAMKKLDPAALPSALSKIRGYFVDHKDYFTLSKYGTYAEFDKRISRLGEFKEFKSHSFQKAVSGVNTFNAILHLGDKHYADAAALVQKNITQKVATEDDYVLLAKAYMGMYNTEEKNLESLSLIQQAKSMAETPNLNTDKQEILALMRLKKQAKAVTAIQDYITHLSGFQEQTTNADDLVWTSNELKWAKELLQRVQLM